MTDLTNTQVAPYPNVLEDLVAHLRYRPGWRVALEDIVRDPASSHGAEARGLTFIVTTLGFDSYHPERGETYRVNHYFPVPAATYNYASWQRWLLDCILKVESHEACEFFVLEYDEGVREGAPDDADGLVRRRPFAPTHGPGDDPYIIHEYASTTQRRTRFTGEVLDDA